MSHRASVGDAVTISPFDAVAGEEPSIGANLVAQGGTRYRVVAMRRVANRKPLPAGIVSRWFLICVVIAHLDPGVPILDLYWYSRDRVRVGP